MLHWTFSGPHCTQGQLQGMEARRGSCLLGSLKYLAFLQKRRKRRQGRQPHRKRAVGPAPASGLGDVCHRCVCVGHEWEWAVSEFLGTSLRKKTHAKSDSPDTCKRVGCVNPSARREQLGPPLNHTGKDRHRPGPAALTRQASLQQLVTAHRILFLNLYSASSEAEMQLTVQTERGVFVGVCAHSSAPACAAQ